MLNRRPGGSAFCWVLAFSTTSCHQRVFELLGAPRAPLAWRSFPYHNLYATPTPTNFLSWLSYILVQRPPNRPFNLWNGMFDRHQAEITVMQFTGHSLPVHQSMSVPWDIFFYLVPFHQPNPAYAITFDYWPLGCVTSFWSITLEWHICPGWRSKYNTSPRLVVITRLKS